MPTNVLEFTVSEFSRSIKRIVEDAFGYVRIKGEITGFKRATSGHLYFTLKDENSSLSAVCFRGPASLINFEVADGLQVSVSGKITTFEGRSNYQIIVEKMEISGVGAILEMIEKRRQKLAAEGLFDVIHKKPIPFFPKLIGLITSETGAVIQDIKHRISERCPTHIMLYPTLVQGAKAPMEIIAAIKFFNKLKAQARPDILIIARGGGSFEDLLPFNDEDLVREVFKSDIPIISAIGHETDTSLIDYAADLRAPTPSAAAEMAVPVLLNLKKRLNFLDEKLEFLPINFLLQKLEYIKNLEKYIAHPREIINKIEEKLSRLVRNFNLSFDNFFNHKAQKLNSLIISNQVIFQQINLIAQKNNFLFNSLKSKLDNKIEVKNTSLKNLEKLLKSHHYQEILNRGFALLKSKNNEIIFSKTEVKLEDEIIVEMSDGKLQAKII